MEIARDRFTVEADFHQYYLDDGGEPPDVVEVDASFDGIVGLDVGHARVFSVVQRGPLDVDLTLTDEPIAFPLAPGTLATAFALELRTGRLYVRDWEGSHPPRFVHDFGGPTRCAVLIEVHDRDEADRDFRRPGAEAGGSPERRVLERHVITVSTRSSGRDRWRPGEVAPG